jgi:26 proteasome complex subunit DSS1
MRVWKADWTAEETEAATGGAGGEATTHLWEESWDDDDTSDDFSAQLKYVFLTSATSLFGHYTDRCLSNREELKKVEASKRR